MTFRLDGDYPTPQPAAEVAAHIQALETEAADMRDRWMRAEAEMANVRSRARRDVEDARLFAVQKFATDVVEGVENLRRGIDSLPIDQEDNSAVAATRLGLEETERNFISLLARNGVVRDEAYGDRFDPERHQSVGARECADAAPGLIVETLSAGWLLHDRLLRPAMVIVAKAPVQISKG